MVLFMVALVFMEVAWWDARNVRIVAISDVLCKFFKKWACFNIFWRTVVWIFTSTPHFDLSSIVYLSAFRVFRSGTDTTCDIGHCVFSFMSRVPFFLLVS